MAAGGGGCQAGIGGKCWGASERLGGRGFQVCMPAPSAPAPSAVVSAFTAAVAGFDRGKPVWVLGHNDADGLAATALFARGFGAAGWDVRTRIVGRGESAYSDEIRAELRGAVAGGVVITDLGVRPDLPIPGVPTVVVDHHVPGAAPAGATVITGFGMEPIPTSSLLAYWCAGVLADAAPWLWIAAVGMIGDMAEDAGFAEMAEARRFGVTALRAAASLVNAPRRTAAGDASAALRLLMTADGPKAITAGESAEARALAAAKAEVKAELDQARRVAPRVRGGVALIEFSSAAQIHPLIAQQWRGRLKGEVVLAANTGYRPGWVHFAVRSAADRDLIAFLAEHRPPGADEAYGNGHRAATGGALRPADWAVFLQGLGFGGEARA